MMKKLSIAFLSLILAATATELALRLFLPQPQAAPWRSMNELGLVHLPGEEIELSRSEFQTGHQANADGFVDVEHTKTKPKNTRRVAVLGDSFVEALQVPMERNFCRLLESGLNENCPSPPSEVLNFGVAGAGTAAEYLLFRSQVQLYHPDVTVLMFFLGNDVLNNHPLLELKSDKPFLRRVGDRLEAWTPPPAARTGDATISQTPLDWLRQRSHLVRWAYSRFLAAADAKSQLSPEGIPRDFMVFAVSSPSVWDEAWEVTGQLLESLADECRRQQSELLVVAIPDRVQVYPNLREDIYRVYPRLRTITMDWELPNRRLRQLCAAAGISFLDLLPTFTNRQYQNELLYFIKDGHWNEAGHRAASVFLRDYLCKPR